MTTQSAGPGKVRWARRASHQATKAGVALGRHRWFLAVGFITALTLIIAAAVWILGEEQRSDDAVSHTFQTEKQLARVLSLLQDGEVGQRGYLLTGDPFYLDPFTSAFTGIDGELKRLADDMADNSRQDGNLAVLRSLVAQKMSELHQTVERRRAGDVAGALGILQGGQGRLLMDGIRSTLSKMQDEEERLMEVRTSEARASIRHIEATIFTLLLLCGGLALLAFGSTLHRARSAEASRDELLNRFSRKLMAVMAADVTAYSRMMEGDEAGTLARLFALRERVDPLITKHGGRITSTAGDSILAVFPSALSAVDCAVAMQTPQNGAEGSDAIQVRIGINVGDVIEQGGDVFGDTVNIAARLESLADPGGICVSRAVRDHVSKQRRHGFDDLGLQSVKNIAEPVSAYVIRV